jgi:hypothetical protein
MYLRRKPGEEAPGVVAIGESVSQLVRPCTDRTDRAIAQNRGLDGLRRVCELSEKIQRYIRSSVA